MKSTTRIMLWVFATLGGFTQVQSQTSGLCNSAALKPVFIQDFGTASSPTATSEAAPGSTSYIYGNVGTDGHYIITPLVQNAHKSDWAIGGDHTGNTNGNMFLVNAGGNNSIYFRDTVSNLCDGSVFNFSAWLANVNSPNTQTVCGSGLVYARVIFNVKDLNGNILGTITTGNLPLSPTAGPLNWNQYGFQFALPAGMNTLVLEMVDYYGGGAQCGNDLALDDILFTACTPNVTANITTANSVCVGSTANIVASLVNNPFTAPAYQWQKSTDNGTTWNNIGVPVNTNSLTINNVQLSDSGLYRVLVGPNAASLNSASCITASNSIQLSVHPIPIVSVQSNSPLCAGGTLFLSSTVNGNNNFVNNSKKNNNDNDDNDKSKNNHSNTYSYQWNGPNGFTSTLANPSIANVTTAASGSYLLTLTDNYGCSNTAQTSVTVNPLPVIAPITGDSGTCAGSTVQLTTTTKGGVWSSSNTSVATIDTTGKVTAISAGTTTITYTMTNQYGCSVSVGKSFTVNSVQMLPAVATCNNGTIKFSNTPYMPTYGSSSGIYLWTVTGGGTNYVAGTSNTSRYPQIKFDDNSIDTVTVAYTVNGITCSSTQIIYIRSTMPISGGADTLCAGTTATFVNPVPGGTWSSSNTGVATVSQAGIVTAIAAGTTTLSYTNACGQTVTRNILVQAKPIVNPIQASANAVCMGNTLTVNTTSVGGVWMSSNTQVATIDSITGAVTILQPGTTTITYTLQNKCGIASQSITITVNPLPTVQPINTGSGQVCAGSSVTVTDATPGGVWSSSNTSVATIDNSGKITAIAAGTTTITYTVTNGSGCTTSVSAPITVNPLPTVQPINTGSGQVCAGSSVTVTDATPGGVWSSSNTSVATIDNSGKITAIAAGTTTITYTVTNGSGCTTSVSAPVTIIGIQKASIQLKDTGSTCLPYTLTLINKTVPSSKTVWYFSDGTSLSGDSVRYAFKNNGQYAVKLITQTARGCTYADSMPLSVHVPERTVSFNSGYTCINNNVTFNAHILSDDSVRWNFGDGRILTTTQTSIQHHYIKGGTYIPSAQLIAATGCEMPLSVNDTIKVDELKANFHLTALYKCGKTTYQFMDSSHTLFGIQEWNWKSDEDIVETHSSFSQNYTTEGNRHITLVVKGKSGCSDTAKASFKVKIYQYPKVSIQSMQEVCRTALVSFNGIAISQDSIVHRQWDMGNGNISNDSVREIRYNNAGDYVVKYTVSTVNQCLDSAIKQITVHALPKVAAMAPQRICKGDSIQLNVNGAERYIWKDQKNNIICENCATPIVKPDANTQYYVVGYNEFGCSQMSATNIIVVQPFKLLVSPNDTICAGQQKQIIAIGANNYQWVAPDGSSLGTSSSMYVSPITTTTYSVIAKDSYNCFTDTGKVSIIVGNPTQITVGKDTILQAGDTYNFRAVAEKQDIKQWAWSGANNLSCYNCQEPQAKISDDACISCVATNVYGCQSADTVCLKTFCPTAEVYIPNVFTPDGDGINDLLIVQGKGIKVIKHFMIFNRWGELLFERSNFMPGDPAYAWDGKIHGKPATPDVFVYVCEVLCEKGLPNVYKGNVAILK